MIRAMIQLLFCLNTIFFFFNSFPLSRTEHHPAAPLILGQNRYYVFSSWHFEMLLPLHTSWTACANTAFYFCIVFIVLLGVLDQKVGERTFQAKMERRVAMLLGEALGLVRRVKRATIVGNNSVQVLYLWVNVFNTGFFFEISNFMSQCRNTLLWNTVHNRIPCWISS